MHAAGIQCAQSGLTQAVGEGACVRSGRMRAFDQGKTERNATVRGANPAR